MQQRSSGMQKTRLLSRRFVEANAHLSGIYRKVRKPLLNDPLKHREKVSKRLTWVEKLRGFR